MFFSRYALRSFRLKPASSRTVRIYPNQDGREPGKASGNINTSFKSDKRKVSNPKIDYSIGEKGGRPSGGEYVDPIQINATCYDQLLQITLKATKPIMKAKIKVLDNQRNLILEQKDLSIAQEWTFCIFSMAEGYPYFLKLETDAIDFWASIHEPGQKSWFPEDEE